MASGSKNLRPTEQEGTSPTNKQIQIDPELGGLLFNGPERTNRLVTLIQQTVLGALASKIADPIYGEKKDAVPLQRFLDVVDTATKRVEREAAAVYGNTAIEIAQRLFTVVGTVVEDLDSAEGMLQSTEANERVLTAIREAINAIHTLVKNFTVGLLKDEAILELWAATPSKELAVKTFLRVPEEKKPTLMFREMDGDDPFIEDLFKDQNKKVATPEVTEQTSKPKKVELDGVFLGNLWTKVREDAFSRLQIEKGDTTSKVENDVRREFIALADEQELQRIANQGLKTVAQAKEYLACVQGIIDAVPATITIGDDTLEVPGEFKEHLNSRLQELSSHLLKSLPADTSTVKEQKNDTMVDTNVTGGIFINPLAEIVERAQRRRKENQEDESRKARDEEKKIASLNPIVFAASIALGVEDTKKISIEQVQKALCRGVGFRIVDEVSLLLSGLPKSMSDADLRSASQRLQTVVESVCTAFKNDLTSRAGSLLPTPEQVADSLRAAISSIQGEIGDVSGPFPDEFFSSLDSLADELAVADGDAFYNVLQPLDSDTTDEHVAPADTSTEKALQLTGFERRIQSSVENTIAARKSEQVTEDLTKIRRLVMEMQLWVGPGPIHELIKMFEPRHLSGDTQALQDAQNLHDILLASMALMSPERPSSPPAQ